MKTPRTPRVALVLLLALLCAGATRDSSDPGAYLDTALLSEGRVVAVGFEGFERSACPVVVLHGADGAPVWTYELGAETVSGRRQGGGANAVVSDGGAHVYAAGRVVTSRFTGVGVVAALDADGTVLWEVTPSTDDESEIAALALADGSLYAAGYARTAPAIGSAQQGMLVTKLDAATGAVQWTQVLEKGRDFFRLRTTTAVDVAVSALGEVAVTGIATQPNRRADWIVALLDGTGTTRWISKRSGKGDVGADDGAANLARSAAFDGVGGLYVAGTIYDGVDGSDAHLVRYDVASGDEDWVEVRDTALAQGRASFDRGDAVATQGGRAWMAGALGSVQFGNLVYDGFLHAADSDGDSLWQRGFGRVARSGEEVFDLALDAAANAYTVGTGSARGVGKDLVIEARDAAGAELWSAELDANGGDRDDDRFERVRLTDDGRLIAAGRSASTSGIGSTATLVAIDAATGDVVWAFPDDVRRVH